MQVNNYLNGSNCNVFCKLTSYQDVLEYLNSTINDEISFEIIDDSNESGVKYRINYLKESIDFHVLIRNKGGDRTSKIILGAYNFFKNITTDLSSNKEFIQQHLMECNSSVGIKCSTEFSDYIYLYIIRFGKHFEGLIFNGLSMLDEEGELILDIDGTYSAQYKQSRKTS